MLTQLEKFGTKETERPKNPTATAEEPRAKPGYCTCSLNTASPKPTLDTPLPSPHIRNQLVRPLLGEWASEGNWFVLPLMCCSGVPIKFAWKKKKNSKLFLIHVTTLNFNKCMTAASSHDHWWYLQPFNESLLQTRYGAQCWTCSVSCNPHDMVAHFQMRGLELGELKRIFPETDEAELQASYLNRSLRAGGAGTCRVGVGEEPGYDQKYFR